MKKRASAFYKILIAFFALILFSGSFPGEGDLYFEISKNIELFGKVYKEISFNYVDDIDPEEFMHAGIKGMLSTLDPYTNFIDENKKDEIELITHGKYGGVGISIGVRGDKVSIIEVLEGYSAQKQGLRIGDVLIGAGDMKVTPDNIDDVSTVVKGEPGTSVEVKVLRNGSPDTLNFNLIREEVKIKNVEYAGFLPENSNNVYLKLTNFSRTAGDEVRAALKKLKDEKEIKTIVLDLRNNPGGLLDVAVDICDKFLSEGQLIVSTLGREESSKKSYFSKQQPMVGTSRLAVLVNNGSASASEILAGAFQDHDRGIIIGEKTFGKGLVQTITPLSFNTSLKLTTAKYYTPSGRCIQEIDYSKDNDVIKDVDSLIHTSFLTDNDREVFSAGGIIPDSVVAYDMEGDITKELLAKGLLFKFADHYYYKNKDKDFYSLKDSDLISQLKDYLSIENFDYKSKIEKQLKKLVEDAEESNYKKDVVEELKSIQEKFSNSGFKEIELYENEILTILKQELAIRFLDKEAKIKEMLKNDPQYRTAVTLLENSDTYNKILKVN